MYNGFPGEAGYHGFCAFMERTKVVNRRLLEELSAFGADTEGALALVNGDADFYCSLLKDFANASGVDRLYAALMDERYEDAYRLANTMNGVTVNLGLVPLNQALDPLVRSLGTDPFRDVSDIWSGFVAQMEQFMDIMGRWQ